MKKGLLTESEIRKFMKFANLGTLTENFINNNIEEEITEETVTEENTVTEEEAVTEENTVTEEETVTEEVLTEEDVDVSDLVKKLMQVITDETGVEVTVEDDAASAGEEEIGLEDPEVETDVAVDDVDGDPGMPGDEAPESGAIAPEEGDDEVADFIGEEIVQEVTRRVAARLLKENKK